MWLIQCFIIAQTRSAGALAHWQWQRGLDDDDCGCDDVTPAKTALVNDVVVSAASLRSLTLADAAGRPTRAGELIGDDGAAVVCFLRHLG